MPTTLAQLATFYRIWSDPMHGEGYQFWSGIGSDVFLLAPFAWWFRHHNCHVPGCWRVGHVHDGLPVCRKHR